MGKQHHTLDEALIARCADELKRQIPCRPPAKHLAAKVWPKEEALPKLQKRPRYAELPPKHPVLWSLLAPAGAERMSESAVGNVMESRFRGSILSLREGLVLPRSRKVIDVETARLVLKWQFLDDTLTQTDARRYEAIRAVGGGWDLGAWKRAHGPEWAFCHLLAKHLMNEYSGGETEEARGDEDEAA